MEKDLKNDYVFCVSFGYYKQGLLFEDAKFTIHKNKVHLLVGNPGAGKSTLFEILSGINKDWLGNINGVEPKDFSWGESITFLPSKPVLFENKSVRYNLEYALKVLKIKKHYEEMLLKAYEEFGLEDKLKTKVKKLSYIEKQKVALARSFIKNAKIVFIDDFFKNAKTEEEQNEIFENIEKVKLEGKTVIIAVNNGVVPKLNFDYILKIENKKIEEKIN